MSLPSNVTDTQIVRQLLDGDERTFTCVVESRSSTATSIGSSTVGWSCGTTAASEPEG